MAVFDLLCCVPSHCHYKLKSPSDKLLPFTYEYVTHQRPPVRFTICREGMEGVALGGMFLMWNWGDSWQLCDPESTFERLLKYKQAPRPAGIAHLLLQIIKQINRGQKWCKMTTVYLWGLCSLLERQQVCQWAVGGTLLVPALCTGAELWSGVRGFFCRTTYYSSEDMLPRQLVPLPSVLHLVAGMENAAAEALSA